MEDRPIQVVLCFSRRDEDMGKKKAADRYVSLRSLSFFV
jgi:hypothetical protein